MERPLSLIEDFHRIASSYGLEYQIVGGFAASFWGTPRFTGDVDIALRKGDFEKAKSVAEQIDYSLVYLHPQTALAHFCKKDRTGFRLDLMLVSDDTWSRLHNDFVFGDLGGTTKFPIVSSFNFIAMKLHAAKQPDRDQRFKDINDIVETMLAQGISFGDLEERDILQKHGNQQTITLLRDMFDSRRDAD